MRRSRHTGAVPNVVGLLLAAGSGTRYGGPKALAETDGVPWVVSAAQVLRDGGCDPVVVVVGAAADRTIALLGEEVVVRAPGWESGMGASLRAGLAAIAEQEATAVMVHLVDLPDVGAEVVNRVAGLADIDVLARADYGRGPSHPVLIGRDHWAGVAALAAGDHGARDYLALNDVISVACADLATGTDVDEAPPILDR